MGWGGGMKGESGAGESNEMISTVSLGCGRRRDNKERDVIEKVKGS